MRLRILHIPDCPNVGLLEERLRGLVAGRPDIRVARELVASEKHAALIGMAGSPTLLVDGTDPFAGPERATGLSCRLYRDETGRLDRAPSVSQLRHAFHLDEQVPTSADAPNDPPSPAAALAGWRARSAPSGPAERAVLTSVLRAFASTGQPPTPAELDRLADTNSTIDQVLARLHDADILRLDPAGAIAVAYPFSVHPTRHRVRILDGPDVHAMCAVDALGISPMLGAETEISSTDPLTAQPITVQVADGQGNWRPATAVVVVATRAAEGPSADRCCSFINFFASRHTANTWTAAHPDLATEILNPAEAEQLGRRIFGSLLNG